MPIIESYDDAYKAIAEMEDNYDANLQEAWETMDEYFSGEEAW